MSDFRSNKTVFADAIQNNELAVNLKMSALSKKIEEFFWKNGYDAVEIPVIDLSQRFILNNNYAGIQNLYKTVAGDGQVLALPDDIAVALINVLLSEKTRSGRYCSRGQAFSFLSTDYPQNKDEMVAVLLGSYGKETDAEVCNMAAELLKSFGLKCKISLGNTEIAQGILESTTQKAESRERTARIIDGYIENEADFSTSQIIQSLKKLGDMDAHDALKAYSSKIENKRSIDGLLNIFEILSLLEVQDIGQDIKIDPLYLGDSLYENEFVFKVEVDGKKVVSGGRINAKDVNATVLRIDPITLAELVPNEQIIGGKNEVTIMIADSLTAYQKAQKLKEDFYKNELRVMLSYKSTKAIFDKTLEQKTNTSAIIVFVDEDGMIYHN